MITLLRRFNKISLYTNKPQELIDNVWIDWCWAEHGTRTKVHESEVIDADNIIEMEYNFTIKVKF